MPKFVDLTGQRFGKLTAVKKVPAKNSNAKWICQCDCGNCVVVRSDRLKSGHTASCGCMRDGHYKHGKRYTRLYTTWHNMKQRCLNTNHKSYKDYGGRGITVCQEWIDSFEDFYEWAVSNGYEDHLTIDRIDNDKGYAPGNVRWATMEEQANNKRNNKPKEG